MSAEAPRQGRADLGLKATSRHGRPWRGPRLKERNKVRMFRWQG